MGRKFQHETYMMTSQINYGMTNDGRGRWEWQREIGMAKKDSEKRWRWQEKTEMVNDRK